MVDIWSYKVVQNPQKPKLKLTSLTFFVCIYKLKTMKKTILLFLGILLLSACTSVETESLALEIKADFQSRIDAQYSMYEAFGVFDDLDEDSNQPPIVKDVKVYQIASEKFFGLAKIEIDGKQKIKLVRISIDEDGYYWEVE